MYSPKIRPDVVERLYQAAKARQVPMTALVNEAVEEFLKRYDYGLQPDESPPAQGEATGEAPVATCSF